MGDELLDSRSASAGQRARFLRLDARDGGQMAGCLRLYENRAFRNYQTRNRVVYRLIKFELELV